MDMARIALVAVRSGLGGEGMVGGSSSTNSTIGVGEFSSCQRCSILMRMNLWSADLVSRPWSLLLAIRVLADF